jgi:phosphatidylserine/phosphatidylglycerophosphate/cardiolipin synthase-like enzyme
MILVDRSKAYVGSVNLTSASIDENRELGIILSQGDVVNRLYEVFRGDWEKGLDIL